MKTVKPHRYLTPDQAKKHLFYWLLAFGIAISVPVYFLLDKVYSQLENEAWYRQRNQAENLVQRIEQQLLDKLNAEQARPIAEYSFFNVLENPLLQSTMVNFSPLADLSPNTDIPGLIGYFQINPDGSFQIPALPELDSESQTGLSSAQLLARKKLKQKLQNILAWQEKESDLDEGLGNKNESVIDKSLKQDRIGQKNFNQYFQDQETRTQEKDQFRSEQLSEKKTSPKSADQKSGLTEEKLQQLNIETTQWKKKRAQPDSDTSAKSRFDEVYRQKTRKETVKIPEQSLVGRIFSRQRTAPSAESSITAEAELSQDAAEGKRVRSEVLPPAKQQAAIEQQTPVRILSFETEVSPLQLISLASGNFCFYRNAWSGKSRYIQGFIVNDLFFKKIIQIVLDAENTGIFSSLLVVNQGNVLQQYKLIDSQSEILLFQRALYTPFQQMEIFVNTASLSLGSSRYVLDSICLALALIIITGFILFYRLGARQIELNKQQRNFISSISHELKTPLTSIRMYSELLRTEWVADEIQKKGYYDYIYFESERLSRLIDNVLQLARLDNHKEIRQLVETNAGNLLRQVQGKVAAQVDAAKYQLNLITPESQPIDTNLKIDLDAFFQIMINLVDNAIKFSKQSDQYTIDIGYRILNKGQEVVFYVRDYGPGVDKENSKKIFRLFYRAGDELTRTQPGTGIGLALVKQLAESMHATVDMTNRSPGAEFQVKFLLND